MKGWIYLMACVALISLCGSVCAQKKDTAMHHKGRGHEGYDKRDGSARSGSSVGFSQRIYRVTQADSLQQKKMKPIVDRTSKRIDALRLSFQKQEKRVMDSLSLQLKPILKEDQLKRLNDFNGRDRMRRN